MKVCEGNKRWLKHKSPIANKKIPLYICLYKKNLIVNIYGTHLSKLCIHTGENGFPTETFKSI